MHMHLWMHTILVSCPMLFRSARPVWPRNEKIVELMARPRAFSCIALARLRPHPSGVILRVPLATFSCCPTSSRLRHISPCPLLYSHSTWRAAAMSRVCFSFSTPHPFTAELTPRRDRARPPARRRGRPLARAPHFGRDDQHLDAPDWSDKAGDVLVGRALDPRHARKAH